MIYKVKYKVSYTSTLLFNRTRLYHVMKVFVIEKGCIVDTVGQTEIDGPYSKLWYKNCNWTEVTNTVLISMLEGTNIQRILSLNIIFRT